MLLIAVACFVNLSKVVNQMKAALGCLQDLGDVFNIFASGIFGNPDLTGHNNQYGLCCL